MSLKKNLTLDFVLLFINETPLLKLCPPDLLMTYWFLPKRKVGRFYFETRLFDSSYFLVDF
jgi:hypothetical protein